MSPKLLRFALFLFICASFGAKAEDEPPLHSRALVEFDLLIVQLPESAALPLIRELRDQKRAGAAADKLVELTARGKANLIAWPVLTTLDGQRAVFEQVDEFRYATEYESPGRAKVTDTKPATTESPSVPTVPVAPDSPPPSFEFSGRITTTVSEFDGIPTSFETRNLGVSLEIDPAVAPDGKTISLSLIPQHNSLLAMRKIEIEDKSSHRKVVVEQPEIVTNKLTTSLSVQSGDTTLLGVFKVPEPKGYLELFILHTQLKPALAPPKH